MAEVEQLNVVAELKALVEVENFSLPPNIKKQWVENLRSGEYEQGEGSLFSHDEDWKPRYCCLGVFYKTVVECNPPIGWGAIRAELATTFPVEASIPLVIQTLLASINDGGMSFSTIADIIEEYL